MSQIRIYRGMDREWEDRKVGSGGYALNGYSFWTDSLEVAEDYGDIIYYIDIEEEEILNDEFENEDGGRSLIFFNYGEDKGEDMRDKRGREILIYHGHEKFKDIIIKKLKGGFKND